MTLSTTNRYHWIGYSVAILVPVIGSVLITSGKDYGFAQHARRLREIIAFAKIELHDELRNGNLYATRHRVLCTRRSGEEVDMEVYMFAEIDDSGRFIRIEEATLMLKGRESDKDLGSVR